MSFLRVHVCMCVWQVHGTRRSTDSTSVEPAHAPAMVYRWSSLGPSKPQIGSFRIWLHEAGTAVACFSVSVAPQIANANVVRHEARAIGGAVLDGSDGRDAHASVRREPPQVLLRRRERDAAHRTERLSEIVRDETHSERVMN